MLGVRPGADAAEVRAAYRRKVKECHPDQFTDAQRQKQAQDELIRLNLAYEQALKLASQPVTPLIKVKPLFSFSAGMGLATL